MVVPAAAILTIKKAVKFRSLATPIPRYSIQMALALHIQPSDYEVISASDGGYIGRGGFADLYKGSYQGKDVAIKIQTKVATADNSIPSSSSLPEGAIEEMEMLQEANILAKFVDSKGILQVYGVQIQEKPYCIVMELAVCNLYDLLYTPSFSQQFDRLLANTNFTMLQSRLLMMCDVAEGLACLHSKNFIHNDIKPDNVLFFSSGCMKLSDFGLASHYVKPRSGSSLSPNHKHNHSHNLKLLSISRSRSNSATSDKNNSDSSNEQHPSPFPSPTRSFTSQDSKNRNKNNTYRKGGEEEDDEDEDKEEDEDSRETHIISKAAKALQKARAKAERNQAKEDKKEARLQAKAEKAEKAERERQLLEAESTVVPCVLKKGSPMYHGMYTLYACICAHILVRTYILLWLVY